MPLAIATPDETLFDIFRYCQHSFARFGVRLAFPANTQPQKTYKWRYLVNFLIQVEKLGLEITTAYKLIDAMVDHAHTHKQLRQRGLAILACKSILNIGHRSITQQVIQNDDLVSMVERDLKFIEQYPNRILALTRRETHKGGPNILKWHMQGKLSSTFLAISKSCRVVMSGLTPIERAMLPTTTQLLEFQRQCTATVTMKWKFKIMLGDDWGVIC